MNDFNMRIDVRCDEVSRASSAVAVSRARHILVLVLLLMCARLRAQTVRGTFDLVQDGASITSLEGLWRSFLSKKPFGRKRPPTQRRSLSDWI
jgi:hypothetical protein